MDENQRNKLLNYFFENIGIEFQGDTVTEMNTLGVQIVEDIKVVPEESWIKIKGFLKLKYIAQMRLQKSLELLKESGAYNPFLQQKH